MPDINQLPQDYIPYEELIICSNKLINGKVPFKIDGQVPLLVGKGEWPLVWLFVSPDSEAPNWAPSVLANESMRPDTKVNTSETNRVSILFNYLPIIDVFMHSPKIAEILQLDLRPLGIDIHGDSQTLYLGTNKFSHNAFTNVQVMIGIGEEVKPSVTPKDT